MAERDKLDGVVKVIYFDPVAKLEKPDAQGAHRAHARRRATQPGDKAWLMSLGELRVEGEKWLGAHAGRAREALGRHQARRQLHLRLHLGHHRAAQGRGPHAQEHRVGVRRDARRAARRRERRAAAVPADGAHLRQDPRVDHDRQGLAHRLRRVDRQDQGQPRRGAADLHVRGAARAREGLPRHPRQPQRRAADQAEASSIGRSPSASRYPSTSSATSRFRSG